MSADKSSLGSGRSFRSSERSFRDDLEPSKKRIPKLSNCQNPRSCSEDHSVENKIVEDEQELNQTQVQNSPVKVSESTSVASASESPADTSKSSMSKTKMLRNLFFFQNDGNSS
jgi:hypothetical protein